ncbi:MAG: DUF3443 family protein [Betaproteobacteria bacterium]|nr:MAG: DUF3443 family protein [Betaproteobacteria bacterium]
MSADSRAFRLALLTSAAAVVSACGGGSSSSSSPPPPPPTANVAAMIVDGGPVVNGMPIGTINQGYVTITVCVPGTSTCQNIDHVWVDTGSAGLRLITSAFTSQLPATMQGADTVANCVQFVNAFSWGAVRTADVKIAGESASSVPIQVIGDTAVPATAPSTCGSMNPLNTVTALGANGLLGVGVFRQDCGLGCTTNDPVTMKPPDGFYYTCPANSCSSALMPLAQQLHNPVGLFGPVNGVSDNNGVLLQLPSLPASGMATATGSLIFGIGTRSNNALGSAVVFAVGPTTGFIQTTTTFAGGDTSEPASYIDSGSNGFFFNDSNITQCTGTSAGFFCPSSTVSLSATMLPYNTSTNTTSHTYSFSIADIQTLTGNAFNNVGGPSGTCDNVATPCTFDWGLPFFYGRSVFTALENTTITGNAGPFFAASTP